MGDEPDAHRRLDPHVRPRGAAARRRIPAGKGDGRSKSAVSRRFVALSAAHLAEWMASDLSKLDLLAIQIDGVPIKEALMLVAAVGIDAEGSSIRSV